MIIRYFTVYLNRTKQPPLSFNVNQYDRGEKWVFTILEENGTEYTPTTCSIVGRKSDGHGIAVEGTVENGKAVIYETEQMTAAPGKAVFELSVDDLTHGTANFIVNVEKRPLDEAVMSDSDLSLIEQALEAGAIVPENEGTVGQILTRTENGAEWADGGGGGGEFVITFTSVEFEDWSTTADKTYTEVMTALNANIPIVAYHVAKDYGGYFDYDMFVEQLTLVRKPNGDGKSLFFFGTPAFFYNELTSQFTNLLQQSAIKLHSDDSCEWNIISKTIAE